MSKREHQHGVGRLFVAVKRKIARPAARDDQLSHALLGRAADERMVSERLYRFRDQGNRFSSAVQTRVSELVQRTRHPTPALVQHMGVDHRGRNVGVAEKLLHCADVVAAFEQVSGK